VVTKVNLAPKHQVDDLLEKLRPFGKLVVPMSYELMRIRALVGPNERPLKDLQGQKVMLVSGIAQPLSFEKSLEKFSLQFVEHLKYRDHHPYSQEDIDVIVKKWREVGSPDLITTEKDFVKLKALWPKEVPLWYSPLEVQIQAQEDGFYEILDQVLH
jgi:tetraacyldisaccharide 4'-kinase